MLLSPSGSDSVFLTSHDNYSYKLHVKGQDSMSTLEKVSADIASLPTLLIWQEVPDDQKLFLLSPQTQGELLALARFSAGKYVNGDDLPEDHPIFTLNMKISAGELGDSLNWKEALNGPFGSVIICGFCL